MNHLHRTRRRNDLQNHSCQPSIAYASKMFEDVPLSTHSTSIPEVLSRECVGRFPRYPSKPAGSSRRDKASRARPPFESLSQASLGQAQLHILFAEENISKLFSLMDALSTLWSRVISSTLLDRSLHRVYDRCEQHPEKTWHSRNALMNVFQTCTDPLVDTIECRWLPYTLLPA